ncbi:MAG TPA: hypothetical protein VKA21_02145, partial [Candidatus Binatia bacterium]|nr:hypothetical protein [Candidatus Binatia bacterium]
MIVVARHEHLEPERDERRPVQAHHAGLEHIVGARRNRKEKEHDDDDERSETRGTHWRAHLPIAPRIRPPKDAHATVRECAQAPMTRAARVEGRRGVPQRRLCDRTRRSPVVHAPDAVAAKARGDAPP